MAVEDEISSYLASIPEPRQSDMRSLHAAVLEMNPGCRLWFADGRDEGGKVVSNPSIGYGAITMKYADGRTREFYQAGISANSSGLTVYIMGLDDRTYLPDRYSKSIGKAKVTGYCFKFRSLKDIDMDVLMEAIQDGIERTRT
jgi:hypothetical protein